MLFIVESVQGSNGLLHVYAGSRHLFLLEGAVIDVDKFDMYYRYRMQVRPYNTDPWVVLRAALWFATVC